HRPLICRFVVSFVLIVRTLVSRKYASTTASAFFSFHDTAPTETYTLSLHDALPILNPRHIERGSTHINAKYIGTTARHTFGQNRSEEHTSELQSRENLVCRLLLEKKKKKGL